jgi:hypothetical protein
VEESSEDPYDIWEPLQGRKMPREARAPEGRAEQPEFIETNMLSFAQRNRKTTMVEQFTRFVDII